MPGNVESPHRKILIQYLARVAAAGTAHSVLEKAVREGNKNLVKNSVQMLETALNGNSSEFDCKNDRGERVALADAWNSNLTWKPGVGYTKTVANVLAKGMPTKVAAGECSIQMCPQCFWEAVCSRENIEESLAKHRQLIEEVKAFAAKADARKSRGLVAF